uniref:Uncharacterized protein n=1 Tax=Brassica oleracea TaxID=3712 RepID=A0A3P6F5X6_BRAOL|nr:unnamed protein product [Brassica oleracea]
MFMYLAIKALFVHRSKSKENKSFLYSISLFTLSLLFFTLFFINFQEYHPLPECACGGCVYDVAKRALEAREKEKLFGFLMGLDRKLGKGMARIMLMKPHQRLRTNRAETRGVRGGIDRQESDLIYFRSEYGELIVAAEQSWRRSHGELYCRRRLLSMMMSVPPRRGNRGVVKERSRNACGVVEES